MVLYTLGKALNGLSLNYPVQFSELNSRFGLVVGIFLD